MVGAFFYLQTTLEKNMSNLLVGTEATIEIPCKAIFQSAGTKPVEASFIAVFTRLSRSDGKKADKELTNQLRRLRAIGKDTLLLEHGDIAIDEGKLVPIKDDDDLTPLTDEEINKRRDELDAEAEAIGKEMDTRITNSLHNIKNLMNTDKKPVEYSHELVAEMLDYDPYFIALRDGLRKSNGVVESKRTKN